MPLPLTAMEWGRQTNPSFQRKMIVIADQTAIEAVPDGRLLHRVDPDDHDLMPPIPPPLPLWPSAKWRKLSSES
jgi:hypothetical protein